jgi:hypothetical protein
MAKVIVINDSDGHTTVLNYNLHNLKQLLTAFLESGQCDNKDKADLLLDLDNLIQPSERDLEDFIISYCPNVNNRGGDVHIMEPIEWAFRWNPFY